MAAGFGGGIFEKHRCGIVSVAVAFFGLSIYLITSKKHESSSNLIICKGLIILKMLLPHLFYSAIIINFI